MSGGLGIGNYSEDIYDLAPSEQTQKNIVINWFDYNYPPCVKIFHYDLVELRGPMQSIMMRTNLSFLITSFNIFFNFLNSILAVIWVHVHFQMVITSLLHVIILSSSALLVFYWGLQGLAKQSDRHRFRFKVGQTLLALIYGTLAVIHHGPINGVLMLGHIRDYTTPASWFYDYWIVAIIVESSLWGLNAILALINVGAIASYGNIEPRSTFTGEQYI